MSFRPVASLSLDLDNLWSYLKTHGDPSWSQYSSYLPLVVPRVLAFLDRHGWRITFFVVGKDATAPSDIPWLRCIAESGHEIGNHSFHHEPWLHLYSEDEVDQEITSAEQAIEQATGSRPRGFRGPGFSVSPMVLGVLARRGYLYDASTFPTYLGPLARAYYFATARLTPEQKAQRRKLFGTFRDGLRPLAPYYWKTSPERILEIPVTTFPWVKFPIHLSYLLYLATFSRQTALSYFRAALMACRVARISPSLLLHPLDFLGADDVKELSFFPAMALGCDKKMALCREFLQLFASYFTPVTMAEHAHQLTTARCLAHRSLAQF
jgi:peptidoglycan/xylan/chitin deacetylase (PgdA/CDA1 family)